MGIGPEPGSLGHWALVGQTGCPTGEPLTAGSLPARSAVGLMGKWQFVTPHQLGGLRIRAWREAECCM